MPTLPTLAELGGCEFVRPSNRHGYGQIMFKGVLKKAHRLVWEQHHGEIPKGMHVDHICHNVAVANDMCLGQATCVHRSCININHLRLLTPRENQLEGLRGLRNRKTCTNGHDLTLEGAIYTRNRPGGTTGQMCKQCKLISARIGQAKFRARKKEALIA